MFHYDDGLEHRFNREYRDNPLNIYHDTYQSAVNRWTVFLLICLIFGSLIGEFGTRIVFSVFSLIVISIFCLVMVAWICVTLYIWLSATDL